MITEYFVTNLLVFLVTSMQIGNFNTPPCSFPTLFRPFLLLTTSLLTPSYFPPYFLLLSSLLLTSYYFPPYYLKAKLSHTHLLAFACHFLSF